MQSVNLPLFELENTKSSNNIAQSNLPLRETPEEKVIAPLSQVLDHITPISSSKPQQELEKSESFTKSLNNLFPEQQYDDKDLQKAKDILGDITTELNPEQLNSVVSEFKYLAESWLNDFERDVFGGQTLQELLHNKK
jgi:hypothetical protein